VDSLAVNHQLNVDELSRLIDEWELATISRHQTNSPDLWCFLKDGRNPEFFFSRLIGFAALVAVDVAV
jgi:hypothetical protein